ncbi:hypothetical protein H9Q13_11810 [Pontibacter sp. JH31]|uniref:Aminopeptidase n=1 Tax=Pontibacter aquaedesilientis TaxID=2766980 RepID=A0ABR7XHS2_9BACT|nr:hypothetical protein [Pontibacter aquaedesilientis]MBD1397852.1 hypothetical protein [Pontibacter aquaedesilientis]
MNRLILLLLITIAFSCNKKLASTEQLVFDRMAYMYDLKPAIAKDIWPGFDEKQYDVPLIYYTDSTSFIANPTARFLAIYNPIAVFKSSAIKVYKTASRLDSTPFHMAVNFTLGDSSAYDNYVPFMHCSGFEETRDVIEDVESVEVWVTMVVHEYFHGFQFQHKDYLERFGNHAASSQKSKLKELYKEHAWFKTAVDKENELLLQALASDDRNEIRELIAAFFKERETRRDEAKRKLDLDIGTVESTYETLEGTARYVEQKLYEKFSQKLPDAKLQQTDSAYHAYHAFKGYKLEKDQWLYLTPKSGVYFYATGFNMTRLFDKLHIGYKDRLFKESHLSLEDILKTI